MCKYIEFNPKTFLPCGVRLYLSVCFMLDTAVRRKKLRLNWGPMLVCCKLIVLPDFSGQADDYLATRGVACNVGRVEGLAF